jgi:hypothetical protein
LDDDESVLVGFGGFVGGDSSSVTIGDLTHQVFLLVEFGRFGNKFRWLPVGELHVFLGFGLGMTLVLVVVMRLFVVVVARDVTMLFLRVADETVGGFAVEVDFEWMGDDINLGYFEVKVV